MRAKMIQIVGNEHGDFETPVTAILNLTSLTGGTQEEPWEEQGTAYSLEDGKPYIGTYGKDTPVYGNPRKYIQVWECYYREGNWIGKHATYRGNNHIIELSENPKLSAQFSVSTAAATMGRKGGKSTSPAKTAAVRENGRKGGRPGYHPTETQIAALIEFKRHHGRTWKKELRFAWMKAGQGVTGYSAELQQLRNDPSRPESWLDRVVLE